MRRERLSSLLCQQIYLRTNSSSDYSSEHMERRWKISSAAESLMSTLIDENRTQIWNRGDGNHRRMGGAETLRPSPRRAICAVSGCRDIQLRCDWWTANGN